MSSSGHGPEGSQSCQNGSSTVNPGWGPEYPARGLTCSRKGERNLQSFAVGVDVILSFFDTLLAFVIVKVAGLAVRINDPYTCAVLKSLQVLLSVCAIGLFSRCDSLLLGGFVSRFLFCNLRLFQVGFAVPRWFLARKRRSRSGKPGFRHLSARFFAVRWEVAVGRNNAPRPSESTHLVIAAKAHVLDSSNKTSRYFFMAIISVKYVIHWNQIRPKQFRRMR